MPYRSRRPPGRLALSGIGLRGFTPDVRRALRVEISAVLLFAVFAGLTGPFAALILRRELGATPLQLTLMSSASGACLLLSLLWARAMRGHAPLPYVVWPGFIARGLFFLVPFISSPWWFAGLIVAGHFAAAAAGPAQAAVVERVYPRGERGRALGAVRVAAGLAGIGLTLGAGTLLGLVDYRWVFAGAALVGMAASLRQLALRVPAPPPDAAPEPAGAGPAWAAVSGDVAFRRLLVAAFLFGSGCWIQTPANPLLVADVLQATTAHIGVFAAVGALTGLVGSVWWGRLVDGRSSLAALRTMYLVGTATPVICALAWHPWVLVASSITDSLVGVGLEVVWMVVLIDVAGPRRAAQYVAISATLAGVRGVLGPLAGGLVIATLGVRAVYPVAAAMMAGAAWIVARELRSPRLAPVFAPGAPLAPAHGGTP